MHNKNILISLHESHIFFLSPVFWLVWVEKKAIKPSGENTLEPFMNNTDSPLDENVSVYFQS